MEGGEFCKVFGAERVSSWGMTTVVPMILITNGCVCGQWLVWQLVNTNKQDLPQKHACPYAIFMILLLLYVCRNR